MFGFETEKKYNVAAGNYLPRSLGLNFFCVKTPHHWAVRSQTSTNKELHNC
jgi:hypothetical protein